MKMEFEANVKNYNQIKDTDKLDMYEFVDYEFLQFGDYIRFFDKKYKVSKIARIIEK